MAKPSFSWLVAFSIPAPGLRGYAMGEEVHLHRGAACEYPHHGAGRRLNFRGRLADLHAGDPLDLLPQRVGGVGEQLSVKTLYLSGTLGAFRQGLLGLRQGPVQRDHQRGVAQHHGHGLGRVARPLLLENTCRLGDLLRHGELDPAEEAKELAGGRTTLTTAARPAAARATPYHSSPGMEIDLRGQRVEDGLDALERYLESAYLAGLPFVRIIHGKGIGVQREIVRSILAKHPAVQSFRHEEGSGGGWGATVVTLHKREK